eukprot:scaffold913_cov233-Pinguiococcus_pyrenoidosus.AAC.18
MRANGHLCKVMTTHLAARRLAGKITLRRRRGSQERGDAGSERVLNAGLVHILGEERIAGSRIVAIASDCCCRTDKKDGHRRFLLDQTLQELVHFTRTSKARLHWQLDSSRDKTAIVSPARRHGVGLLVSVLPNKVMPAEGQRQVRASNDERAPDTSSHAFHCVLRRRGGGGGGECEGGNDGSELLGKPYHTRQEAKQSSPLFSDAAPGDGSPADAHTWRPSRRSRRWTSSEYRDSR